MCHVSEEIQARRTAARNVRVFKSHFGKHPLHLSRVWRDLQIYKLMPVEEAMNRKSFEHFLIANNFLRCYEVDDVRNARFGINLDEMEERTWAFVDKICGLKQFKIKCPAQWPVKLFASADGTQVPTNEPRDPNVRRNPKNYSYKYNIAV